MYVSICVCILIMTDMVILGLYVQFSPTSGHILLAYGRRHNSLLRSLVVDGSAAIPIRVYTILEVRTSSPC